MFEHQCYFINPVHTCTNIPYTPKPKIPYATVLQIPYGNVPQIPYIPKPQISYIPEQRSEYCWDRTYLRVCSRRSVHLNPGHDILTRPTNTTSDVYIDLITDQLFWLIVEIGYSVISNFQNAIDWLYFGSTELFR